MVNTANIEYYIAEFLKYKELSHSFISYKSNTTEEEKEEIIFSLIKAYPNFDFSYNIYPNPSAIIFKAK